MPKLNFRNVSRLWWRLPIHMYVLHMYQYHKCNDCRRLRDAFEIVPFIGNYTPKDAHLEASAQTLYSPDPVPLPHIYFVHGLQKWLTLFCERDVEFTNETVRTALDHVNHSCFGNLVIKSMLENEYFQIDVKESVKNLD